MWGIANGDFDLKSLHADQSNYYLFWVLWCVARFRLAAIGYCIGMSNREVRGRVVTMVQLPAVNTPQFSRVLSR